MTHKVRMKEGKKERKKERKKEKRKEGKDKKKEKRKRESKIERAFKPHMHRSDHRNTNYIPTAQIQVGSVDTKTVGTRGIELQLIVLSFGSYFASLWGLVKGLSHRRNRLPWLSHLNLVHASLQWSHQMRTLHQFIRRVIPKRRMTIIHHRRNKI